MKGIGGCPMAKDELVGNIATENIVLWADANNIPLKLNREALDKAWMMAANIFI
jgi:hydroxymethylglutaryl-CoA lyase